MPTIDTKLAEALENLLKRDQSNTCQHEQTHRGGAIWTICDDCGAKWADDMGGKPTWRDPKEWRDAELVLAAYRAEQAEPAAPPAAVEPAQQPPLGWIADWVPGALAGRRRLPH